jgi:uncharacterized protein YcbX
MAPSVSRISIAPVKSLGLVHPESVELTAYGVTGDRVFAVVDAEGKLANGTKHGPLVRVQAAYDGGRLTLTLPDGTEVSDEVRLGEALAPVFYGEERPARLVEGPFAAALSEIDGSPVRLVRMDDGEGVDRPGDGVVSLLSTSALAAMADQAGAAEPVDGRRFRMTFLLDGLSPNAEDSWIDREVRIGGAVLRVRGNIGRCSITQQDPDTGIKSFDTLKLIQAARGQMPTTEPLPFGVHAEVVVPGLVAVGDAVEPLD